MHRAVCHLVSSSPYSQGAYIREKKTREETHEDHEKRSWKLRCHTDDDGNVYIPPMAFKKCLEDAAKYKSVKIPGKGNAKYTKHFLSGVLCVEPVFIGIHIDDVKGAWRFVSASGESNAGKRVEKCFPEFSGWDAKVEFLILDDTIHEEIFTEMLVDAGKFIGIGVFRPQRGGYFGRFSVESIEWVKE